MITKIVLFLVPLLFREEKNNQDIHVYNVF